MIYTKEDVEFYLVIDQEMAEGRLICNVGRWLQSAFFKEAKGRGLKLQVIADRLGVEKSVLKLMLKGNANLTIRQLGALCWAMRVDPEFSILHNP